MSAALKSYRPRPVNPPSNRSRTTSKATVGVLRPLKAGVVRSLPVTTAPTPLRRTLGQLYLASSVLATCLVGLALVGYGTSVYVDQQLNQATQRLSQLQRSEQQITTANASLTRHMAHQVEQPEMGLQPPKPNQVIFLELAPQRPARPVVESATTFDIQASRPLGY